MADSHQRSPIARANPLRGRISGRAVKIAAPLALVATLAPVGVGVVAAGGVPAQADLGGVIAGPADAASETRAPQVSRSAGKKLRTLKAGTEVLVTGREGKGRAEIVLGGKSRWVEAGNFSDTEPIILANGDVAAPCAATGGSTLGLTSSAVRVLNAVCANFPQISTYGGRDPHGEHVNGEAIDIMTSDRALGTAIADYLIAHASEFGIEDVIWYQQIWMPGFGWKGMSDRGSATANHYDHVHVKVY